MPDLRMPDLNAVTIAGRVTRDPELKYTANNKPYCKFSIANSRRFKIQGGEGYQEDTTFVDCTVWGQGAEYVDQQVKKGHAVLVEGRLSTSEWADKEGNKRSRTEIQAHRVTPLEWHNDKGEESNAAPRAAQAAQSQPQREPEPQHLVHAEDDIPW